MKQPLQGNSRSFSDIVESDPWTLQIILNVFALSLEIPLRAFDRNLAKSFWARAGQLSPIFAQRFSSEVEFLNSVRNMSEDLQNGLSAIVNEQSIWRGIYLELGKKLWVTSACYEYPLILAFRSYWPWRWWQTLWTLDRLRNDSAAQNICYFGTENEDFQVAFADLHRLQAVLVAGPVWSPVANRTGDYFSTHRALPMVQSFWQAIESAKHEQKYSLTRLERLSETRKAISGRDLQERVRIAQLALMQLLTMRFPIAHRPDQCDLIGIAEWALFTTQTVMSIDAIEPAHPDVLRAIERDQWSMAYRIDRSYRNANFHSQKQSGEGCPSWVITDYPNNITGRNFPGFVFVTSPPRDFEVSEDAHKNLVIRKSSNNKLDAEDKRFREVLEVKLSRYLGTLENRIHANKMENLYFLREWLTDNFGAPTAPAGVEESWREHEEKISFDVVRRLSQLVHSEISTLYRYNSPVRELRALGVYHTWNEFEVWKERFPEIMRDAAKSPEMRQTSLSYRAIDHATCTFSRMYDPQTGAADPPGETLIKLPKGAVPGRCGIAVPICVFERPWGILEVVGARPYQFRWEDLRLVEDVATLLSPFYYHQWFLRNLHGLNRVAVDRNMRLKEKYNEICRRLAAIFSCHSVVMWLRSRKRPNQFICEGWYNRPDLDQEAATQRPIPRMSFVDSDTEAVSMWVMQQRKIWWQGTIGEGRLAGKWLEKRYTKGLLGLNIKTVAFIPVPSKTGIHRASLSIFSDNIAYFDKKWEPIVIFVRRYLSLLLEAIHAHEDLERTARQIITHEMKTNVEIIRDRAKLLVNLIDGNVKTTDQMQYRLNILCQDLETHSHDLTRTMTLLSSEKLSNFLTSNDNPVVLEAQTRQKNEYAQRIDIREQFNIIFRSNREAMKAKGIYIQYVGPNHGPYIFIHPENFREILINLLSNALKYTPKFRSVYARIVEKERSVNFSVINEGNRLLCGDESRIFQKGFRGANALEINEDGQGLGLFIAREICNLYGIDLLYRSRDDNGGSPNLCFHEFTVSIPKTMVDEEKR